jgi:hypothetical protein
MYTVEGQLRRGFNPSTQIGCGFVLVFPNHVIHLPQSLRGKCNANKADQDSQRHSTIHSAQGYHWVDMRRASSDISQAANAIVARATATPMNQRECEYHPSGEGGATPTGWLNVNRAA